MLMITCMGGRDHPRVCGEHLLAQVVGLLLQGSSPRMRGAQRGPRRFGRLRGIIPAYAGSTMWTYPPPRWSPDHPRVCGEHRISSCFRNAMTGSSPRMRGAPAPGARSCAPGGIIPAYAGSTTSRRTVQTQWQDHPRVCGEHIRGRQEKGRPRGSSPRMRGALR